MDAHWLVWFELDHYCVCAISFGEEPILSPGVYIMVNNPMLNRNFGKYNLNHIWDRVLFNTPGLKIGSSQNLSQIHNNGQAQSYLTNGHPQIIIGQSEHALNSEHALTES